MKYTLEFICHVGFIRSQSNDDIRGRCYEVTYPQGKMKVWLKDDDSYELSQYDVIEGQDINYPTLDTIRFIMDEIWKYDNNQPYSKEW